MGSGPLAPPGRHSRLAGADPGRVLQLHRQRAPRRLGLGAAHRGAHRHAGGPLHRLERSGDGEPPAVGVVVAGTDPGRGRVRGGAVGARGRGRPRCRGPDADHPPSSGPASGDLSSPGPGFSGDVGPGGPEGRSVFPGFSAGPRGHRDVRLRPLRDGLPHAGARCEAGTDRAGRGRHRPGGGRPDPGPMAGHAVQPARARGSLGAGRGRRPAVRLHRPRPGGSGRLERGSAPGRSHGRHHSPGSRLPRGERRHGRLRHHGVPEPDHGACEAPPRLDGRNHGTGPAEEAGSGGVRCRLANAGTSLRPIPS